MSGTLNFLNFNIPFFGSSARCDHALKLKAQQRVNQIFKSNTHLDADDPQLKNLLSEINKVAQKALAEQQQDLAVDSPSINAGTALCPDSKPLVHMIENIAQSAIVQDAEQIAAQSATKPSIDLLSLSSPPGIIVEEAHESSKTVPNPRIEAANVEAPPAQAPAAAHLAEASQTVVQVISGPTPTAGSKPVSNEADSSQKQGASKAEAKKKAPVNFSSSLFSLVLKNFKFVLPAIPVIGWLLYSSKQKIVRNIDLSLTSPMERKIYQITLGNKNNAIGVAFEAASGHPLRFLREAHADEEQGSDSFSLYSSTKNSLSTTLLGTLSALAWKRQEQHVIFDITVNEPFANEHLEKGPCIITHSISDKEFIRISHRRYRLNPIPTEDMLLSCSREGCTDEAGAWLTRKVSINIGSSDKTHHISLPPINDSEAESTEYVRIEQQKILE